MDRFEQFWKENYAWCETKHVNTDTDGDGSTIWDHPEDFEAALKAWESTWIDGPQP